MERMRMERMGRIGRITYLNNSDIFSGIGPTKRYRLRRYIPEEKEQYPTHNEGILPLYHHFFCFFLSPLRNHGQVL
jgi:hypothetical protein